MTNIVEMLLEKMFSVVEMFFEVAKDLIRKILRWLDEKIGGL